uniref:Variant surface glycoprotein 822 n=1 Tax=Trypanosoma brucei TaxID=5691 RepID=M4TDZ1_9TRYP|nr:variant surface glycoprotein 822 [Trypanosoma brucei]
MAMLLRMFLVIAWQMTTFSVDGAQEMPLTTKGHTALCDIAAKLRDTLDNKIGNTRTASEDLKKAQVMTIKLQILQAAATDAKTKLALATLIAAAQKQTQANVISAAAANLQKMPGAIRDTAYFLGILNEYFTIAGQTKNGGNHACFADDNSGTNLYQLSEIQAAVTNCQAFDLDKSNKWSTEGKFTTGGFAPVGGTAGAVATTAKGCRLHSGANTEGILEGGTMSNSHVLAGGLITMSSTAPTLTNLASLAGTTSAPNLKKIARAYEAAQQQDVKTETPHLPKRQELSSLPGFLRALTVALQMPKEPPSEEIETKANELYGPKEGDLSGTLYAGLKTIKLAADHGPAKKNTQLADIDDVDLLSEILLNYTVENVIRNAREAEAAAAALAAKAEQSKEEKCNEIKDAKTCNANKNCKYDDKKKDEPKCVLSEEGEKAAAEKSNQETGGNDVKTTNTTGRNSFVINKAPLLLAFLVPQNFKELLVKIFFSIL